MHILNQRLTVKLNENTAIVTVAYTVIVQQTDFNLGGGFLETVSFSPQLIPEQTRSLPIQNAVKTTPSASAKELKMEHTFHVSRYPAGPFTTVRFRSHIRIRPSVPMHDEEITNEGVLPAQYSPLSLLTDVVGNVARRLRDLIGG